MSETEQSWQIREAESGDVAQLAPLMQRQVEQQLALAPDVKLVANVAWERYARRRLRHPDTMVWVAAANGRLYGFVEARLVRNGRWQTSRLAALLRRPRSPAAPLGVVEEVYVVPAWRRRGVATALVQQAVHGLQRQQVSKIRAAVRPQNEASLQLGQSLGFVTTQVIMQREL